MELIEILLRTLVPASATIYLGGASLLLLRGKENRSCRMLAYILLSWGIIYLFRTIGMNLGVEQMGFASVDLFAPFVLITGNLYVILMFGYPLEIVLPGWLTWRRAGLILLPYLLVVVVYYAVMGLLGEEPERLTSYEEVRNSITHFNVWFRLVIVASVFIYIYVLIRMIYQYEIRYEKWRDDHYASDGPMDISWLRYYGVAAVLILVAYLAIVGCGETWCLFVHNLVAVSSFAFIAYKGLFHESPYPEGFFRDTTDETLAEHEGGLPETMVGTQRETIEESFTDKIPAYIHTFEEWMEAERPYLNKDFKLAEVAKILPLNRSYLSRMFNEGMGKNFSEVIRYYRLRDAKLLLQTQPELSVIRISEICGFSSAPSFNRTFVKEEGITPKQYRERPNRS